jgi:hypothetical protein
MTSSSLCLTFPVKEGGFEIPHYETTFEIRQGTSHVRGDRAESPWKSRGNCHRKRTVMKRINSLYRFFSNNALDGETSEKLSLFFP